MLSICRFLFCDGGIVFRVRCRFGLRFQDFAPASQSLHDLLHSDRDPSLASGDCHAAIVLSQAGEPPAAVSLVLTSRVVQLLHSDEATGTQLNPTLSPLVPRE